MFASSLAFAQTPAANQSAPVKLPDGITEEMLAPPPVPQFMLKKPARQLTVDEMMQQAREAERRSGIPAKPDATATSQSGQRPPAAAK